MLRHTRHFGLRRRAFALAVALHAAALASTPARAQDFFAASRDFVVDRACNATRSLQPNASPTALEIGTSYPGRGVNRAGNPTHAFIRLGSASRWVDLSCGHFADGLPAGPGNGPRPDSASEQQCLPFFDTIDNPVKVGVGGTVDITPPPPPPNAFDDAITTTCGAPGKIVSSDAFKMLLRANTPVLERIKGFTAGKVFADRPARTSNEDYLADLADAWFAVKAFDHIFCGEPSAAGGGKIGGLHFHARYLQLQKSGQACRMNNLAQNEVIPGAVYTMGVIMKAADGRQIRDARKGYGLTLNGEDILKAATRAFSENPSASAESQGCLLPVADDGKQFSVVFVRRAAGIRTFYPDATPNGRGDRISPPCKAGVDLEK